MNTFFKNIFFKHCNPLSPVVSEIMSGVRGSYVVEKLGTLKVMKPTQLCMTYTIMEKERERERERGGGGGTERINLRILVIEVKGNCDLCSLYYFFFCLHNELKVPIVNDMAHLRNSKRSDIKPPHFMRWIHCFKATSLSLQIYLGTQNLAIQKLQT